MTVPKDLIPERWIDLVLPTASHPFVIPKKYDTQTNEVLVG